MKKMIILLFLALLFDSCEKPKDEADFENVLGRYYDKQLLGEWYRWDYERDFDGNIYREMRDTISFNDSNSGLEHLSPSPDLIDFKPFRYYTSKEPEPMNGNSKKLYIYMKYNMGELMINKEFTFNYLIRNDTLIMVESEPHSSKYYDSRIYKRINEAYN